MGQRHNFFHNIPTVQKNANINGATPERPKDTFKINFIF